MKRVFIIHGWGGSPNDNWLPWIKFELQKLELDVFVPEMPDTENPTIEKWVSHLSNMVGIPDAGTYFIGHSIGCQTTLRYLETINVGVGGAIFVAGWFNLKNMESEDEKEIARPWIDTKIDIGKIKNVLSKSTLIISDNDDYGAFEENRQKFGEFVTKEIILHNVEHITGPKYPEILSEIKLLL